MKSNKETVYEFIMRYSNALTAQEPSGLSTLYLSEKLHMQRTNISSILNALVAEGKIEKTNGRPVLYRLKESGTPKKEVSCFNLLIGHDLSLKNAVQLAKAAILYPKQSLSTVLVGAPGSGKSHFARLMHQFAIDNGILGSNAPFVKINAKHYVGQQDKLEQELFGDPSHNRISQSRKGVLFIDAIQHLSALAKTRLADLIENQAYTPMGSEERIQTDMILICAGDPDFSDASLESLIQKFPIKIDLIPLAQRSLEERFQLIQHFFTMEALRTQRILKINSEVLRNLLLYECPMNVKQLRNDIQIGCANAYVREFNAEDKALNVYISDFNHYVRKGFLNYKAHRDEIERIIPQHYSYSFSEVPMAQTELVESELKKQSVYDMINAKITELQDRGIPQKDINLLVSVEMENAFKTYQTQLSKQVVNKEQLSKLVDPKLISLVEDFLNEASVRFNQTYPVSVFYGLSLHLNAALKRENAKQTLSNDQIMDVVEQYKEEYAFCLAFSARLEKDYAIKLPIDEVVLITLFLVEPETQATASDKPVVLVAMHGNSTARSIAEVINALVKGDNAYAYDLSLDKSSQEAYDELEATLASIDRGKGVAVLYDMGSIKTMVEAIAEEIQIKIRLINIPVTLIGLDAARKATMEDNLDTLVDGILDSMNEHLTLPVHRQDHRSPVLVTLCSTGEGGALQLKDYLMTHLGLKDGDIIPLAISDKAKLHHELDKIRKSRPIKALIGTYHPKGIDLPFISITKIFESDPAALPSIIDLAETEDKLYETQAIYEYLDEQLDHVDVKKLQKVLPGVMRDIDAILDNELSRDQKLGLFIHIACSINRLLAKEKLPVNLQKDSIMSKYGALFKTVLQQFKTIEKQFGIIFSDDEIANVITIIKKL